MEPYLRAIPTPPPFRRSRSPDTFAAMSNQDRHNDRPIDLEEGRCCERKAEQRDEGQIENNEILPSPDSAHSQNSYPLPRASPNDSAYLDFDNSSGKWKIRPLSTQSGHSIVAIFGSKEPSIQEHKASPAPSVPNPPNPPPPPPPPTPQLSKTHEAFFIFNLCLAQVLSLAALSQTVAPILILQTSFSLNNNSPSSWGRLSWLTAGFSLTLGSFIMPSGRLGDMYGHKRIFIIGWLWFALFSLLAGFSWAAGDGPEGNGVMMLAICRGLQGIGPSLCVPNAMALVGRSWPIGPRRNMVFGLFGGMGPFGWVIGSVFSSIFAELVWWPWMFWSLAAVCLGVAILSLFVVPPDVPPERRLPGQRPPSFDILGFSTGVTGLILISFAKNQAPIVGWGTPYIYALLIVGFLSMFLFIYIELEIAEHPLLPLRGLKVDAAFALACIAAGWGSHGIWIYYLYLLIERIRGYSALSASAQTFPVAITGLCFALSVGLLLKKKVKVAYIMLAAMIFFLVGTILIATSPIEQTYWTQTFLSVLIMPGGMNLSFPAGTILLSAALPREKQGIAASLVSTVVNYSISSGLGVSGTIERYVNDDGSKVLSGFRGAWYFGIGLSGVGIAISMYFVWKSRKA